LFCENDEINKKLKKQIKKYFIIVALKRQYTAERLFVFAAGRILSTGQFSGYEYYKS
jgi:hypothetical protein